MPLVPYEYAEWRHATVNIDYHIVVDHHYYSVPSRLVRERVAVRLTATTVEIFFNSERVAAHVRSRVPHQHTTLAAHMPVAHQRYQEWTPPRLIEWAAKTGPATAQVVEHILASRAHPEQGYRACLGILRLGTHYGPDRVEAAAHRAVHFRACSYKAIRTMLATGLDRVALPAADAPRCLPAHENVRGETYYHPSPQEDPSC